MKGERWGDGEEGEWGTAGKRRGAWGGITWGVRQNGTGRMKASKIGSKHKMFKRALFIGTKHNMGSFGVIPFKKLKNKQTKTTT